MKKSKLVATVLSVTLILSGCGIYASTAQSGVPNVPEVSRPNGTVSVTEETKTDSTVFAPVDSNKPAPAQPNASSVVARLTNAQAETIAVKHAGVEANQVKGLKSELDIDRGIPHYEVEFRVGQWEYEYNIHAGTGAVLSFEKDD